MEVESNIAVKSKHKSDCSHQQSVFALPKFNIAKGAQLKPQIYDQVIGPQMPLFKGKRFSDMPGFMQLGYLKMKSIYSRYGLPQTNNILPTKVKKQVYQLQSKFIDKQMGFQQSKRQQNGGGELVDQSQERRDLESRMQQESQQNQEHVFSTSCSKNIINNKTIKKRQHS